MCVISVNPPPTPTRNVDSNMFEAIPVEPIGMSTLHHGGEGEKRTCELAWGVEGGHAAESLISMQGLLRDRTPILSSWVYGLSAAALYCKTRVCLGACRDCSRDCYKLRRDPRGR